MKNTYLFALILLAVLLSACSDRTRDSHVVSGRALFEVGMQPMDDIVLSIYQDNGKEGLQLEILGSNQLTAADGGFSFEIRPFKNEEASDILLTASANSRNDLAFNTQTFTLPIVFEEIDPALVLENEDYYQDILGMAFGFLEVEIRGQDDLFINEEINITVSGENYEYKTTLAVGDDLSKIYTYPVWGNVQSEVRWEAKIFGITTQDSDSVFCRNKESTRFRINL